MDTTLTLLCVLLLSLYLLLTIFWIVRTVIDFLDERESKKRNAKWEEEKQQLERERAVRDAEYHTARMKEFEVR